jgi:hypothetical protein
MDPKTTDEIGVAMEWTEDKSWEGGKGGHSTCFPDDIATTFHDPTQLLQLGLGLLRPRLTWNQNISVSTMKIKIHSLLEIPMAGNFLGLCSTGYGGFIIL